MLQTTFTVDNDITLKKINRKDIVPIFTTIDSERAYLGEWLPFVDYTHKVADTRLVVRNMIKKSDENLTCCIYYKNLFVGLIGLKDFDFINHKTEIGYWLSEKYQHNGIITKSCKTLIEYAFDKLDMYRIQLNAAVGNEKSQAVAKRLGFTQEGIVRAAELHSRGFLDIVVFGLLKTEWGKSSEF